MSEEVLIALNDLTNGALNYYQAIETVMVRKQVIENYIKQLQKEKEILKSNNKTLNIQKEQAYKIADDYYKENQELKKQVEEYKEQVNKGLYNTCLPYTTGYNKAIKDKETQQKEFIKYLEDMLDDENDIFSVVRVKDVLQKYKEIVNSSEQN